MVDQQFYNMIVTQAGWFIKLMLILFKVIFYGIIKKQASSIGTNDNFTCIRMEADITNRLPSMLSRQLKTFHIPGLWIYPVKTTVIRSNPDRPVLVLINGLDIRLVTLTKAYGNKLLFFPIKTV